MINLNTRDPRPIYEQVCDSLRKLIIVGGMAQDEKLPSVRDLATTLAINPNTIQRAYRELELEGYVYSVPGKGSFVSKPLEKNEMRQNELFSTLEGTVRELLFLGTRREIILERINSL